MNSTLTREQKKMALRPFATADDVKYDLWGTGMAHLFAIADTLYEVAEVPSEWGFKPGLGSGSTVQEIIDCGEHDDCQCDWAQVQYVPFIDAGELGIEMLTYAGNVINYLVDRERAAGRDY